MGDSTVHVLYQKKNSTLDGPYREMELIGKDGFRNPFFRLFALGLTLRFAVAVSFSYYRL